MEPPRPAAPIESPRSFVRSAGVLAGGTALSQVLALAATPFLTRLYGPQDFGLLAVFASIVSIAIVPATLRLEQAIPVPDSEQEASRLVVLGLAAVLVAGAVASLLLAMGGSGFLGMVDADALAPLRWLLIPALLGASMYQILTYYAIRIGAYDAIARTRVSKNLSMIVAQVGLGFTSLGAAGLVLGEVVNRIVGMGGLARISLQRVRAGLVGTRLPDLVDTARRNWRYPTLSAPSSMVNVAGYQLPVLLLANWFGAAVVGWFALSLRILQAPVAMVGQAVGQVFFSEAGAHHRGGTLPARVSDVTVLLLQLGIAPALIVGVSGPDLFEWVFGAEWAIAGTYSQWLLPWLFLTFVTSPLTTLVFVLDRQGTELLFQSTLMAVRVGALWAGYLIGSSNAAIALFAAASCGMWVLYWVWLMHIAQADSARIGKTLLVEGVIGLCVLVPFGAAKILAVATPWLLAALALSLVLAAVRPATALFRAWTSMGGIPQLSHG